MATVESELPEGSLLPMFGAGGTGDPVTDGRRVGELKEATLKAEAFTRRLGRARPSVAREDS